MLLWNMFLKLAWTQNAMMVGLENIVLLTLRKKNELRVDMADWEGVEANAHYASFSVDPEQFDYTLHLGAFTSGSAGECVCVWVWVWVWVCLCASVWVISPYWPPRSHDIFNKLQAYRGHFLSRLNYSWYFRWYFPQRVYMTRTDHSGGLLLQMIIRSKDPGITVQLISVC